MKKIVYCLVAALALVACTPKDGADQVVRIGVSLDDNTQPNQKGQQRISAVDAGDEININWEEGDVLYYQLEDESINKENPFQLISGAGTKQALFECNAIELQNKTFTLYYNGAEEPNLNEEIPKTQTSPANKINNDYLFYTATNCKIGSGVKLSPKFALLGVRLTSDDEDLTFGQYISIGTNFDASTWDAYMCTAGEVSLKNSPIYYIVLPYDFSLEGKEICLSHALGHNTSGTLDLPNITLDPNEAKIITVKVSRNSGYDVTSNGAHTITQVK